MTAIRRTSWSVLVFIFVLGCQSTPEDARKKLTASGFAYTPESFIERVDANDSPMVLLFLTAGMDANSTNQSSLPPLLLAVLNACKAKDNRIERNKASAIAEALVVHRANVNTTSSILSKIVTEAGVGWTPLMLASACGWEEGVSFLLHHHAFIDAKDKEGATSLIIAAERGQAATVRTLLTQGADINMQAGPGTGKTALIGAASNGHEEVVTILLKYGADVTVRDHTNRTALDWAKLRHHSVAEVLKGAGAS